MTRFATAGFLITLFVSSVTSRAFAGEGRSLVQIGTQDQTYAGRVVAMGDELCWLVARDGAMNQLVVDRLKSFKRLDKKFTPFSTVELRNKLRAEFGNEFEVVQSGIYLVVARRGHGKKFANVLNDVYGVFQREFKTRGFDVKTPEFPLVGIVFPAKSQYVRYAATEGFKGAGRTLGYYKRESNRVAAFEEHAPRRVTTRQKPLTVKEEQPGALNVAGTHLQYASIDTDLRDTLIHEAIHQIAFNTKIHSRIGNDPRWVIEGLATLFEAPGIRNRANKYEFSTRVNRERFVWFGNFVKQRRKKQSLKSFVQSDIQFVTGTLDAYSQAWALSFFLFETRGKNYARFMNSIATRDVRKAYTAAARLKHFEAAFGDVEELEVDFLRYISRIEL